MTFKVVGIGETLWDLLPAGPQLGGAPANFACHARSLGADASIITRVGNDPRGRTILDVFRQMNIADGGLQIDNEAPTGTVDVTLSGDGIPHFTIHEGVAWDRLEATPQALAATRAADAICFGTLAQRCPVSRAAIQQLAAAADSRALRVFDVNLRQSYYSCEVILQSLRLANILKLNEDELGAMAKLFELRGSPKSQVEQLAHDFSLQLVALTRGAAGSALFRDGHWSHCEPRPANIVDTIGAGDAFTAALVMGLLHRLQLEEIHSFADDVARYVCSCAGATPPLPGKLSGRFAAPGVSK